MGVSKVEFGGDTLIDLTEDSVAPETMMKGTTAHNSAGEPIEGEFDPDIYQTKTDDSLETKDKSVVGAINEVNGKTVDKIYSIDNRRGIEMGVKVLPLEGITWTDQFNFLDEKDRELSSGELGQRIPIIAGDNVTFTIDEENQLVKINATGGGSSRPAYNLYPMHCQALAIPKAIQEANGEMFYSIDAYEAAGNMVLGADLNFEEFVDLGMFGSSKEFELEVCNNSDFCLKLCVKVTWEEPLEYIIDRETTKIIYIPPNDVRYLLVYPYEQDAADEQSWYYQILGARFMLNDYD